MNEASADEADEAATDAFQQQDIQQKVMDN